MTKRILIICRKAPYGNSLAREALDIALAASVFEQSLAILFLGDGVWQLLKNQNSEAIDAKNHSNLLSAFPLYDINELYVDETAMDERQLTHEQLVLPVNALNQDSIASFVDSYDVILSF